MITTIIFDLGRVLVLPKDRNYTSGLSSLYHKVYQEPDFNFFDHFDLNDKLLEFTNALKNKYEVYVFTFGTVHEAPEVSRVIGKTFKEVFSAKKLNFSKEDSSSYSKLAEMVGKNPSEILFIDDKEINVQTARKAGLAAIQYQSVEKLKETLRELSA